METVFGLFPRLKERLQPEGRHALRRRAADAGHGPRPDAQARASCCMDEPSMGLAPVLVELIFDIIRELNHKEGTTILLVEQNAHMALSIAHRGYVLQTGAIVLEDTAANLRANVMVRQAYLGED